MSGESALRPKRPGLCLIAACAAWASACSRPTATQAASGSATSSTTPVAALDLAYEKPAIAGTAAQAAAAGLPPGKTVDLTWGTVTGGWVVEDSYHFRGKKYSETTTA